MGQATRFAGALMAASALSACAGGGGGGSVAGLGSFAPPPPVTPPPPAAGSGAFETAEYRSSWALGMVGAAQAYAQGGTGDGVTVAVIDTGVDADHPELIGNLNPASTDIVVGRDELSGPDSHGTFVAGVVAAAKDDTGLHGLAFDADILAIRADIGPGDYSDDGCDAPLTTCGFDTPELVAAVNYAVENGADIINMSLGGATPDEDVLGALREAAEQGVLIVAAAGNDGTDAPLWPALFSSDLYARGLAVSVGSVDVTGTISDFSNHAVGAIDSYLLAPGEDVSSTIPESTPGATGDDYGVSSGTSFAAPYVAASLALLLDAFPGLTPAEALDILFQTATDYAAAGPDDLSGYGLINLAAAFQPVGTASVEFGAISVDANKALAAPGGAFGDFAFASGLFDDLLIRDAYDRGFSIDPHTAPAANETSLNAFEAAALTNRLDARAARTPFGSAAFRPGEDEYIAFTNLESDDEGALRVNIDAGRFSLAAGRGFAAPAPGEEVGGAILSSLAGSGGVAPLASAGRWTAACYDLGHWSVGLRASGEDGVGFQAAHIARRLGAHELSFETGLADEGERAFGSPVMARFGGVDDGGSSFAALAWDGPLARRWRAAARVEGARADLASPAAIELSGDPTASAWSLAAERPVGKAALGFTLSQPLRVEGGRVTLNTPVAVDEDNRTVFETRSASLTPSGREIGLETSLRGGLTERIQGSAAVRVASEPGHVATASAETSAWLGLRVTR